MPATPTDPHLYAKVKAEAKRRFERWPSAYASAWLSEPIAPGADGTDPSDGGASEGSRRGSKRGRRGSPKDGVHRWMKEEWVQVLPAVDQQRYLPCGGKKWCQRPLGPRVPTAPAHQLTHPGDPRGSGAQAWQGQGEIPRAPQVEGHGRSRQLDAWDVFAVQVTEGLFTHSFEGLPVEPFVLALVAMFAQTFVDPSSESFGRGARGISCVAHTSVV